MDLPDPNEPTTSTGRSHRVLTDLGALVLVLIGIKLAAPLLVPILLALFIATLSSPLVRWLQRRGMHHVLAVTFTLLFVFVVVFLLGLTVVQSGNTLYSQMPIYEERLLRLGHDSTAWFSATFFPVSVDQLIDQISPSAVVGALIPALTGGFTFFSYLMLVLLVVAFLLFEGDSIHIKLTTILELLGEDEDILEESSHDVQKYLIVKTMTSLATGILTGVWAAVLGLDFAILWGILSFTLNFIPTIGSWIAVLPPFLLALVVQGPASSLLLGSGFFVVNFTIGQVVEPRVMGRALGLSPTIVLLSIVVWGWLLGPVGAVVSVPITMLLKIILGHSDDLVWVATLLSSNAEEPQPAELPEQDELELVTPDGNHALEP